jgi:hypothetical protein
MSSSFALIRSRFLLLDVQGLDSQQSMTGLLNYNDYNDFLLHLEIHQLPIFLDLPPDEPKFDRIRTHTSYHQKQHRDFEEPPDFTDDDYERMEVSLYGCRASVESYRELIPTFFPFRPAFTSLQFVGDQVVGLAATELIAENYAFLTVGNMTVSR